MKRILVLIVLSAAIVGLLTIAACSGGAGQITGVELTETAMVPTALPTEISGQNMHMSENTSCVVKQDASISVSDPQGDLLAWSPAGDKLAYVRPANGRWAWFVGDLVVYDLQNDKEIYTSKDQQVFGDIVWSPDGETLAYVVLDPEVKIYNVFTVELNGGKEQQVFDISSARTDDWSSPKGIIGWTDDGKLTVTSSCGLDCARVYTFDPSTSELTIEKDERKSENPALKINNGMTSPNGTWQVTVDNNDNFWLWQADGGHAFALVAAEPVSEWKWSPDSRYLALRTADKVYIYQVKC